MYGQRVEALNCKEFLSFVRRVRSSTPKGEQRTFFCQKHIIMHHSFDTQLAQIYGLEEAIMIGNFQHWILKNKANQKHEYEGRTWTYNSIKAFSVIYPYWTPKQIRRILDSLVSQNVLIKGSFTHNQYDRTLWYAFLDECMFLNGQIELPKRANGEAQMGNCITDIKPNIKPNTIYVLSGGKHDGEEVENAEKIIEKTPKKTFEKPTVEQVAECAKEKPQLTDGQARMFAEQFWNFYESKGWLVGKVKMKNWKSAVAGTWKKKAEEIKTASGTIAWTPTKEINFKFQ